MTQDPGTPDSPPPDGKEEQGCAVILGIAMLIAFDISQSIMNYQSIGKTSREAAKVAVHANAFDIIAAALSVGVFVLLVIGGHKEKVRRRYMAGRAASQARALRARLGTTDDSVKRLTETVEASGRSSKRSGWLFFVGGLLFAVPIDYFEHPLISKAFSNAPSYGNVWAEYIRLLKPTMLDYLYWGLYGIAVLSVVTAAVIGRIRGRRTLSQARALQAQSETTEGRLEGLIDTLNEERQSSNRSGWILFIAGLAMTVPVNVAGELIFDILMR